MDPDPSQPPHPGTILERDFMRPHALTPEVLAEKLGPPWDAEKISAIIAGQQGISEKSAQALTKIFKTPPKFWENLQEQYFQWAKAKREKEQGPIKPKKKRSSTSRANSKK